MFQPLLIMLAFLVVAASGVAQGLWSGRWKPSEELTRAESRLAEVPAQVGDWQMTEEQPISLKERQIAGIVGYRKRVYVNQRTRQPVSILLVCGRPGAIAVHTPEVCFEGAGYLSDGDKSRDHLVLPGRSQKAEFWRKRFVRYESGIPLPLRVYWGWNAEGSWVAPDNPRLEFWQEPVLWKLYVSRLATNEDADPEPCFEFLREFLPALQTALFADTPGARKRRP